MRLVQHLYLKCSIRGWASQNMPQNTPHVSTKEWSIKKKTRTWQKHQPKAVTTNSTLNLLACFLSADGIVSQMPLLPCSSCVDRPRHRSTSLGPRLVRQWQDGAPLFTLGSWLGNAVGRFCTWRFWGSAVNILVCRRAY